MGWRDLRGEGELLSRIQQEIFLHLLPMLPTLRSENDACHVALILLV